MYLETIYILSKKQENVRSIDIARKMNFSKPSVSRAVKNLQSENYIDIDSNGFITLASNGLAIAKKIYERHEVFTQILVSLGVDPEIAEEDACRIEHVVSDETFRVIKKHLKEKGS